MPDELARCRFSRALSGTYASEDYRMRLEAHGIASVMSRCGNCHDNAVMESWFSPVKRRG
jgi:transposase InsO family protein